MTSLINDQINDQISDINTKQSYLKHSLQIILHPSIQSITIFLHYQIHHLRDPNRTNRFTCLFYHYRHLQQIYHNSSKQQWINTDDLKFKQIFDSDHFQLQIIKKPTMKKEYQQQITKPLIAKAEKVSTHQGDGSDEAKTKPAPFFSLFMYTTMSQRILLIIGSITSIISGGVFPFFLLFFADITSIFDQRYRDQAQARGWELCWEFFIIGGAIWLSQFIASYCWNVVGSLQSVRLKKLYYKLLLQQEVSWFDENDPHKIVTRVSTSITAIETATGEKISLLLTTIVTSVASIFLAFFKCWQLSSMMLTTLPVLMIGGYFFMKAMALYSQREKTSYQKAASRTQQALGQIKTVKGLTGQDYEMKIYENNLKEGTDKSIKYNLYRALGNGGIILIFLSMYAFGFWYGKKLIIENDGYNIGVILSAFFCFIIGGSSVGQISPFFKNIADGRIAMGQFLELLSRQKTLVEPEDGLKIEKIHNITLQNVNFHYNKDQPILKDVSISFDQGKISAIVGESGCGKSTIVQLLLRYYDPTEGCIKVNGVKLTQVQINYLRRRIGFVGQQPVLFAMSIAQNLLLADPSLTEEEMVAVLKKANAWQFVQKMERGLDTYVGSGGAQLSGGQKQRIAIARALCKKPQILVLDEATSALDRKNQRQIQQTLRTLQNNRITTIVIAHRLSTIRDADCIYVMYKGELNQKGTHQQLINKGGLYSQLVQTQIAAEKHVQQKSEQPEQEEKIKQKDYSKLQFSAKNEVDQPSKEKQNAVFGKLLKLQKNNSHLLFIGVLGAIASGAVWPVFNYIFSAILSLMIDPAGNNDQLNWYCLKMLGIAVIGGLTTLIFTFAFGLASQRLVYDIRMKLFDKLLRLPVSYYDKKENTAGAISIKLANDAFQLNNMVSGVIGVMCLNLATISISLAFGFYYSWKVTLIALALSPLIGVVGAINMKVIMKFTSMSETAQKFLGSLMSDSVCNIRTVKSLGRPESFLKIFGDKLDDLSKVNNQKHLKSAFLFGMSKGMIMFVEGVIFYIAAILFQDNQVESGRAVFTAVFSVIFAAMGVGQNSQFMPDMAKAKLAGAGIFDILEQKGEDQLSIEGGGVISEPLDGTIEFRNVTFRYPQREKLVLENLSFKVDNQKIALVGHSGSGKSTVIQLLMRFYNPQSGQILVNNKDIKNFNLKELRKQIGLVSQQPSLFIGTVQQNIRYNSGCSMQQIQNSIRISHAQKFITEWDQGLQKQVGEKGTQISGGQKQRIALSRCLVRNPTIYLFDQFTSALDADTEKIVFDALQKVLKNKTSISIAHRLSTVQESDHILVFKDGRIIEQGKYGELMDLKTHFFSLAQGK